MTIAILTYFVVILVMAKFGIEKPHINAVIPTLGFYLSTFTIPAVRKIWLRNRSK